MATLAGILKERTVEDSSGEKHTVGCSIAAQKFLALFHKFHGCRSLYRHVGALCKHQVCELVARCRSFGNWFPTAFPSETITPKFIQLVLEFPRRAVRNWSVANLTEQVVENVDADINLHGGHYKAVRNEPKRMELIVKNQWSRTCDGDIRKYNLGLHKAPKVGKRGRDTADMGGSQGGSAMGAPGKAGHTKCNSAQSEGAGVSAAGDGSARAATPQSSNIGAANGVGEAQGVSYAVPS